MSQLRGDWNYPTAIRFGAGRIAELADACTAAGFARPLLVTDRGLAANPMIADAVAACRRRARPRGLQRHRQRPHRRRRARADRGPAGAPGATGSSPLAAAARSTPARPSPSPPSKPGRCGRSRTSATTSSGPTGQDPARGRRPDHRRHRLGSRPRQRDQGRRGGGSSASSSTR